MDATTGRPGEGPHRTLVVIPAFNEEQAVGRTIADVRAAVPELDLLLVDDGSADTTAQAARLAGAQTLSLPFNTGVGGAVRTGLRYALSHGYSRAVVVDADGQHPASDIPSLLDAVDDGADVAVGSRFTSGRDPYPIGWTRRLGDAIPRLDRRADHRPAPHRCDVGLSGVRPHGDRTVRRRLPVRLPGGHRRDGADRLHERLPDRRGSGSHRSPSWSVNPRPVVRSWCSATSAWSSPSDGRGTRCRVDQRQTVSP